MPSDIRRVSGLNQQPQDTQIENEQPEETSASDMTFGQSYPSLERLQPEPEALLAQLQPDNLVAPRKAPEKPVTSRENRQMLDLSNKKPPPPPPVAQIGQPALPKTPPGSSDILKTILANSGLCNTFAGFCKQQYCSENLNFLNAVEEYKQNPTDDKAEAIYKNFIIDPESENQINIDSNILGNLKSKFESGEFKNGTPKADIFDAAQKSIARLMENDTIPKFTKTAEGQQVASTIASAFHLPYEPQRLGLDKSMPQPAPKAPPPLGNVTKIARQFQGLVDSSIKSGRNARNRVREADVSNSDDVELLRKTTTDWRATLATDRSGQRAVFEATGKLLSQNMAGQIDTLNTALEYAKKNPQYAKDLKTAMPEINRNVEQQLLPYIQQMTKHLDKNDPTRRDLESKFSRLYNTVQEQIRRP
jgi:hypothetical protein